MAKFKRHHAFEVIDKSRRWSAQGCHSWSLRNNGNVNVTINKTLILEPAESFEGPHEHPDIEDWTDLDIEFDMANDPTGYAPVGGIFPNNPDYLPGDPPPVRDTRLVIFKSFLK